MHTIPRIKTAHQSEASSPEITHLHRDMANALRVLSIDAIEKAGSGHPGLPLGAADIVTVLFSRFLKFDPTAPNWLDRDRFILSAGHGSMLLYGLLHLTGYADMSIEEIKNFRQLHSCAAGHPEFGSSAGIETTTGPLGQGLATAVGMAIAERHLSAHFGSKLLDHYTYVLVSDGDLMEGISQEALSLAYHLGLGKLIVLFDDNGISIDGPTSLCEKVDQCARFQACGWDTARVDGHDPQAIEDAITQARNSPSPSFIACKTVIGYGSPAKQGTSSVHGSPLGEKEAAATRKALGWEHPPFFIPPDLRDAWRLVGLKGVKLRKAWEKVLSEQPKELSNSLERRIAGRLPSKLDELLALHKENLYRKPVHVATRKASEMLLNQISPVLPELIGGSADLSGSNNTRASDMEALTSVQPGGRYIHYGVREHAMGAIMNGLALHGGVIPFGGTFLVFSDYCRPAIRLSALMSQRCIYVMTHDSIGLGEDGPTHQPVEHLAGLRAIPNLLVMRPCDAMETAECWEIALRRQDRPSVLVLSRQDLPQLRLQEDKENYCTYGGYVLHRSFKEPRVTLLSSGSEVHLALEAARKLEEEGIPAFVISLPCWELFDMQPESYRKSVIPPGSLRIAIEAGSSMGWHKYVGEGGAVISLDRFGASAPYKDLYAHFQITCEEIVRVSKGCLVARGEKISDRGD